MLWGVAGACVAAGGIFTTLIAGSKWVMLGCFVAQVAVGCGLWMAAERRLRRLYEAGAWSDEELATTRALLAHPGWIWGAAVIFAGTIAMILATDRRGGLVYLGCLPLRAVAGMRGVLMPPKERAGTWGLPLVDWAGMQPIHSDHWGAARQQPEAVPGHPERSAG